MSTNLEYRGRRIITKDVIECSIKEIDNDERTIKSVITTDRVDRDSEVVVTKGLDFEGFRKNPVVLFMHDATKIIGKALWVKVGRGEAVAKTQFAETDFAEEVWQHVKGGFLKGVSIGMDFMTMQRRDLTEKDVQKRADWAGAKAIIEKAEILEFSFVSIPANPDALVRADRKGLTRLLKEYLPPLPRITRVSMAPSVKRVGIVRRSAPTVCEVKAHAERVQRVHRGLL